MPEGEPLTDFSYNDPMMRKVAQHDGSIVDMQIWLMKRKPSESLRGKLLSICEQDGLRLNEADTVLAPTVVKIPLPADKTIDDLMEALMLCSVPAIILCRLRYAADFREPICSRDRKTIKTLTAMFLHVLSQTRSGTRLRFYLQTPGR